MDSPYFVSFDFTVQFVRFWNYVNNFWGRTGVSLRMYFLLDLYFADPAVIEKR